MKRLWFALIIPFVALAASELPSNDSWPQWAKNPQHTGFIQLTGQPAHHKLAQIRYDPFVGQEKLDTGGELLAHYQVPLTEDHSVYMEFKTGKWIPCHPPTSWTTGAQCGPNTWDTEIWNEKRLDWEQGKLVEKWNYQSDWKPEPNASASGLGGWEPVFHPVLSGQFIYVPGAGGTVWKVNKSDGRAVGRINPFGKSIDKNTFVSGPLTANSQGDVFYNVMKLDPTNPWVTDVLGSWLVKVATDDRTSTVTFKTLTKGAPKGTDNCPLFFYQEKTLPWPPSKHAKPIEIPCGTQRPGVNVAPAIAPDGTIYTVSRAHIDLTVGYLVAANPDLTPKWHASLARRLHDGCGFLVPIAKRKKQPNACREGTTPGVDPTTNDWGSGWVLDQASSTPTILPDGSVLLGVTGQYNSQRGHLMKFSDAGKFLGAYDFGWDSTPAVYAHGGTYSIVIKDNHYPGGRYCNFFGDPICKPLPPGPYKVTQISAELKPEWSFKNTTIDQKHPNGYEWCINAPAIDANGVVYVNSEDGNVYVLGQGGKLQSKLFLKLALGAAYTPLSLGSDGKIYTQNDGELFVVGQ
jgi:outer membrane protein assembly factor BamB